MTFEITYPFRIPLDCPLLSSFLAFLCELGRVHFGNRDVQPATHPVWVTRCGRGTAEIARASRMGAWVKGGGDGRSGARGRGGRGLRSGVGSRRDCPHPVVVPRVEFEIAHGAAEAREVVDEVARAHYHLVRGDAELAARAFLRAVPSANNGERKRS